MKTFKQYIREEQKPEDERPPVSRQERHRRMSRSAALKWIISNRISRNGEQIPVLLPPEIDPKAKEENR